MKERVLNTLEAYLLTNRDVLEEHEIKDIEEQIKAVRAYEQKPLRKTLKNCLYRLWEKM